MHIALATSEELPHLSPDDQLLRAALETAGHVVSAAVWTDPTVDWASFDSVVVRSTWDYTWRYPEFLDWVQRVDRVSRLWNPAPVIRWNSHKSYLKDLEAQGIPVTPTVMLTEGASVIQVMAREGWDRAVLKPAVGAGARRTYLLDGRSPERAQACLGEVLGQSEALLQPYLPEVEGPGERSLVHFGGTFSHAVLRTPQLTRDSLLAEGTPHEPTPEERDLALRVLEVCPGPTLYARVDMVPDARKGLRIMEVELIEPLLYLTCSEGSAARMARALLERLPP